jgi:hypothetical protein
MLAVSADRLDLDAGELLIDRQLQRVDGQLRFTAENRFVETIGKVYLHWLRDDRHVPALVLDRLLAVEMDVASEGPG